MKVALMMSLLAALAATPAPGVCVGDCADDGRVTIDELILSVRVELGDVSVSDCPAIDCNDPSGPAIELPPVNCLIVAVNDAMAGCPE